MESEIYLFIKLATGTFDDATDVKSAKKNDIFDSYSNGNRVCKQSHGSYGILLASKPPIIMQIPHNFIKHVIFN